MVLLIIGRQNVGHVDKISRDQRHELDTGNVDSHYLATGNHGRNIIYHYFGMALIYNIGLRGHVLSTEVWNNGPHLADDILDDRYG